MIVQAIADFGPDVLRQLIPQPGQQKNVKADNQVTTFSNPAQAAHSEEIAGHRPEGTFESPE